MVQGIIFTERVMLLRERPFYARFADHVDPLSVTLSLLPRLPSANSVTLVTAGRAR
jgi:hypothetical protein